MSFLGGVLGAVLLLVLDPDLFKAIVPVLILARARARRRRAPDQRLDRASRAGGGHGSAASHERVAMQVGAFGSGVYGGYFGAAQGIILMGILGALSRQPLQRLNGYKNVLATVVNAVAALVFVLVARDQIDWLVVAPHRGRLHDRRRHRVDGRAAGCRRTVLRGVIVVIGLVAIVKLVCVPLMDWALVLGLGRRGARGCVSCSPTIGFGMAVVAAPVRRPRSPPSSMPAALLVPAPRACPVLQLLATGDARHRVAAARLGRSGPAPCSHRSVWPSSPAVSARAISALVRRAHPRHRRPLRAHDRPAADAAQRAVAGAVSGVSGTAAAIGGPFLALRPPARAARSGCARRSRCSSSPGRCSGLGRARRSEGELTREQVAAGSVVGALRAARATPWPPPCGPASTRRLPAAPCSASAWSPASPSSSARALA